MKLARMATIGILAALAWVASCSRGSDSGGDGGHRVERIGDDAISEDDFREYLMREVGLPPDEIDESSRDRFYEEFLAELLLARAAERLGLSSSPERLAAESARLMQAHPEWSAPDAEAAARRGLLADLYVERVLAAEVGVSAEEVEEIIAGKSKSRARKFLFFRQIMLPTESDAARAYRRVTREKESFEFVAAEMSISPDKGALQERSLDVLPRKAAELLKKLQEGRVSRPLEIDGSYYIFNLEARNRDPDPDRSRERAQVRDRLFSRKLGQLRQERLFELARQEGIRPPKAGWSDVENRD